MEGLLRRIRDKIMHMESQKAKDLAENESGSEGFPSETDAASLQGTENTSGEQSSSTAGKQDENMPSGMEERYKALLLGDGDFVNIDRSNQDDIRLSLESIKEVVSDEDWVTAEVINSNLSKQPLPITTE